MHRRPVVSAVEIRGIAEDDGALWRDIRLRALQDTPRAFGSTYEREVLFTEADYRARLTGDGAAALAVTGERGWPGHAHADCESTST